MQVAWNHEDVDVKGKCYKSIGPKTQRWWTPVLLIREPMVYIASSQEDLSIQMEDTGIDSDTSVFVILPCQKEKIVLFSTEREWKVLL